MLTKSAARGLFGTLFVALIGAMTLACAPGAHAQAAGPAGKPADAKAAPAARTILIYGDSLSAAYGLAQKDGWAALLQERLKKAGLPFSVTNASISGETTSGGVTRMADTLARAKPAVTVIALGANDGLRGLPVALMRDNLAKMIEAARRAGSKVVLVGMRMPPNYGDKYAKDFEAAYRTLAQKYKIPLAPFLLDGLADKPALFQPDQLHPVAEAQPILLDNVWKALQPSLR